MGKTESTPDPAAVQFGERIAKGRKARQLTRTALAELIGSSAPVIGRYERAEMTPSVQIAARLADALGLSLDYLTGRASEAAFADADSVRRLEALAELPQERRREMFGVLDAYLRDFHTAKAYAA